MLAARIVLDLGVELDALNFVTVFCTCTPKTAGCAAATGAARQLGIHVHTFNSTKPMIEIVKAPPHGYGSNLNPCIDCRILMFRRALAYMREAGAQFLVTGEVLGERPMSQRRDAMRMIDRESGTEGLVLRPLSAALLEPSLPEREGWVDRARMLSISGRSRKPQIALARELNLNDYPCPAGGCRLTDPGFAGRMKDLLDHVQDITPRDVQLLRWGRHFRLQPSTKAVVGRNEEENLKIAALADPGDIVIEPLTLPGPTTLLARARDAPAGEGEPHADGETSSLKIAAGIAASYTAQDAESVEFELRGAAPADRITVEPLPRGSFEEFRIGPLDKSARSQSADGQATEAG